MKAKKLFGIVSMIFVMLCLFSAVSFAAEEKISGDFAYIVLDNGTVEITEYNGSSSSLKIPSKLAGKKVTVLGYEAFSGNTKVKKVVIPDTVKEIKTSFIHNQSIETIVFGKNVKKLDSAAFLCASKIKTISVPEENKYFSASKGVLYNKSGTKLIYVPVNRGLEKYTVSKKVTVIGQNALRYITLDSLKLPSGLLKIESNGICVDGIKELVIPSSVKKLENYAIYYCGDLEKITIKAGKLSSVSTFAISSCYKLRTVEIPANVSSIGTFYDCKSLEAIKVNTKSAYFKTLDGVLFSKDGKTLLFCPANKKLEKYIVPASVDVIANNAFYSSSLPAVFVSKKVSELQEHAFAYSRIVIYTDAASAPAKWVKALAGRTVYYNSADESMYFSGLVTGLKAKQSASSVVLSWDKMDGATGYRVYQKINGKWTSLKITADNSYKVASLKSGTSYTFAVKPYIKEGGTVYWGTEPTILNTTTAPAKVKNLRYTATSDSVTLTWNKVSGATGYGVYAYDIMANKYVRLITVKGNSFKVPRLSSGKTYKFKVKAYRKVGGVTVWGKASDAISASTKK